MDKTTTSLSNAENSLKRPFEQISGNAPKPPQTTTIAAASNIICKPCPLQNNPVIKSKPGRMAAILMMYSGFGYLGMQRNKGFTTIEGDLMQALLDTGLINNAQFETPRLVRFQRTSKTDKNVSACAQLVNLLLPLDRIVPLADVTKTDNKTAESGQSNQTECTAALLNRHLPRQIRILDAFRVTKNFHSKGKCAYRTYEYICPSFAFGKGVVRGLCGSATSDDVTAAAASGISSSAANSDQSAQLERTSMGLASFRISSAELERANQLLQTYLGTHNFHNFTSKRVAHDASCKRYIKAIRIEPELALSEGLEFVSIKIDGQSFMLHQIRKMIALVMAICQEIVSESCFERVFAAQKLDIPKAPGLGLMLSRVHFPSYNAKHCADGSHISIDWQRYQREMDEFKREHIVKVIMQKELEQSSMITWMSSLPLHTYDVRESGPPSKPVSNSEETASPAATSTSGQLEPHISPPKQSNEQTDDATQSDCDAISHSSPPPNNEPSSF